MCIRDRGYPGLIISTSRFDRLETEGEILRAGSGVLLSKAASLALKCGLTGLEFAAGIPGTVGGACVMNAGAYGSETKDVLLSACLLYTSPGSPVRHPSGIPAPSPAQTGNPGPHPDIFPGPPLP